MRDNDWIEAVNRNGVVVARAVVSHRMPEGTVYMYHAQERMINVPQAETNGRRGGIHNSLTRLLHEADATSSAGTPSCRSPSTTSARPATSATRSPSSAAVSQEVEY